MKQYRAWYDNELFEMVYEPDSELYFRMASDHGCKVSFETPFIDTDWIVEEGLEPDKNGKLVFMGDIARYEYWDYQIIYNKGCFIMSRVDVPETWCPIPFDRIYVIGTIHIGVKQ